MGNKYTTTTTTTTTTTAAAPEIVVWYNDAFGNSLVIANDFTKY